MRLYGKHNNKPANMLNKPSQSRKIPYYSFEMKGKLWMVICLYSFSYKISLLTIRK